MPVDEIKSTNSVLPTGLQGRDRAAASQVSPTLTKVLSPVPAAVVANQDLTAVQQAALLVNETLQGLNFLPTPPSNALLINETTPLTETLVETQALSLTQQAALAVNDTLQTLTTPQVSPESTNPAVVTERTTQNLTPGPPATSSSGVAVAGVATGVAAQGLNLTAQAIAPTQATPTPTATTAASEVLNPVQTVPPPLVLDRNPIAVPVYEIRDPKPSPPDPKPRRREVVPPLPLGRVRPVDRLVLRQEWERRKESGHREVVQSSQSLEEKSIRQMVNQANEDLAANGLPLRLVLAKNNEGYCLDIYDCSDDEACHLSQEVPLDLKELLTILDNIQHETGIIVNIKT